MDEAIHLGEDIKQWQYSYHSEDWTWPDIDITFEALKYNTRKWKILQHYEINKGTYGTFYHMSIIPPCNSYKGSHIYGQEQHLGRHVQIYQS